jgi:hypothetical protein
MPRVSAGEISETRKLRAPRPVAGGMVPLLRITTALVWLVFGLGFKVLGLVPRHERIVAAVLGETWAAPVTLAVGVGETLLALWILSRWWPRTCASVQTAAIVVMNTLELRHAQALLLAPVPMVVANTAFLAAAWFVALRTHAAAREAAG